MPPLYLKYTINDRGEEQQLSLLSLLNLLLYAHQYITDQE
jgi:hypothetical protein